MARDILAEEQLKLEVMRVLNRFFLRQIEDLVRDQTGAFFQVERIENLILGRRLGRRKELQLCTVRVVDALQNRTYNVELAFKFHKNSDEAITEANGATWLGDLLQNNYKIHTPKLLYFSPSNSLLIYEGLKTPNEFFDSDLDEPQKLFLTGLALPYVHGIFNQRVFVDRYLHLISGVTNGLQFSSIDKNELNELFKDGLRRIGLSNAGANSFGDFHPGNIMFQEIEGTKTSDTNDLRIDRTCVYLIDPAYVDRSGNVDRIEDIGTFLSKFAYNDYYMSQSLDKTFSDLELIVKGYNYTISRNGLTLEQYYPEGFTFDFHIALGILIDTMFKVRASGTTIIQTRIQTTLEAVKYILKNRPFEDID